ncbi:hypothetical protein LINPERHAP2_LOCUS35473 [Linum perenne]
MASIWVPPLLLLLLLLLLPPLSLSLCLSSPKLRIN